MIRFLDISNHALFWYYLASNFCLSDDADDRLETSAAHQRSLESHRLTWINDSPLAPPIAIIAPAHNEEGSIRVAVRNLLELITRNSSSLLSMTDQRMARSRKCARSFACGSSARYTFRKPRARWCATISE